MKTRKAGSSQHVGRGRALAGDVPCIGVHHGCKLPTDSRTRSFSSAGQAWPRFNISRPVLAGGQLRAGR